MADHVVGGTAVFPGAAYLALISATHEAAFGHPARRIRDFTWLRPFRVEGHSRALLARIAKSDGRVSVEDESGLVLASGWVESAVEPSDATAEATAESVIAGQGTELGREAAYALLASHGLDYGPAFQGLEGWQGGPHGATARVALRGAESLGGDGTCSLHPGVIDCAFQAASLWVATQTDEPRDAIFYPFFLGQLRVFDRSPNAVIARVRCRSSKPGGGQHTFDIEIADATGRRIASLRDYSLRAVRPSGRLPEKSAAVFFAPEWIPVPGQGRVAAGRMDGGTAWVVDQIGGLRDALVRVDGAASERFSTVAAGELVLRSQADEIPRAVIFRWEAGAEVGRDLEAGLFQWVAAAKAWLRRSPRRRPICLVGVVQVAGGGDPAAYTALAGFLKSLREEDRGFEGAVLEWSGAAGEEETARAVGRILADPESGVREYRYRDGGLQVKRYREVLPAANWTDPAEDRAGVYLVTGGLGGLGRFVASKLGGKAGSRVALMGRSRPESAVLAKLEALGEQGIAARYFCGDVSRREDVRRVLAEIREGFGPLRGIVHCAGVTEDGLLPGKETAAIESTLAPKVLGAVLLDEETRGEALEFFVCFSSISGALGNRGQSDYAFANAFLDRFAERREELRRQGLRSGKSCSIAWPYWAEGGMVMDVATQKLWSATVGMEAMPSEEGWQAFGKALALADVAHCLVIYGNPERIRTALGGGAARREDGSPLDGDQLRNWVQSRLVAGVAAVLKIPVAEIDPVAEISEFGFDSISITEFANHLNEGLGLALTPAIVFEHPSLKSLIDYVAASHGEGLRLRARSRSVETPVPGTGTVTTKDLETRSEAAVHPAERGSATRSGADAERARESLRSPQQGEHAAAQRAVLRGKMRTAGSADSVLPAESRHRAGPEPIAVIGMSGIFPAAPDLETFFRNLVGGKDAITEVPLTRWDWRATVDPMAAGGEPWLRWGGFVEGMEEFDAGFFGISRREAEQMDPQHRIFLQEVWHAVEDAGYSPERLAARKTGLFVGVTTTDYADLLPGGEAVDAFTATGHCHCIIANRISYLLNLTGPSEAIDTACSSSLVAVHRAVQAVRLGECAMAIAGGVHALMSPRFHQALGRAGMLSADGRCRTFDADANGYVRGEGVGAIVLKLLSAALADGDRIHALILGTGVNHGGHVNTLTTPNPNAQAELLSAVYRQAEVPVGSISYLETHGTGTRLGDPIEINALKKVFAVGSASTAGRGPFCGLGSVKSNIGHLEAAAGIAGLLKTILCLERRILPASIHFKTRNPYIQIEDSPFYIVDRSQPWNPPEDTAGRPWPRRAGVSSFGFGGSNAHVLLEEAPSQPRNAGAKGACLITLSAKSEEALLRQVERLAAWLDRETDVDLPSISHTLNAGRAHFEWRLGIVADSPGELRRALEAAREKVNSPHVWRGRKSREHREEVAERRLQAAALVEETVRDPDAGPETRRARLGTLAALYCEGCDLDWLRLKPPGTARAVSLPGYPFNPQRIRPPVVAARSRLESGTVPKADESGALVVESSTEHEIIFCTTLSGEAFYLRDHVLAGQKVLPAVVYLEMARVAARLAHPEWESIRVSRVVWLRPMAVESRRRVELVLSRTGREAGTFEVRSREGNETVIHAQGRLSHGDAPELIPRLSIEELLQRLPRRIEGAAILRYLDQHGLRLGPSFQGLEWIQTNGREA
ncbi:MAG: SDR family NAD(P)-dependent oxidoreductase, partial [Verrucomicrobia bacterium]|nr:SDR family NAD(P)-dependent oxidoreductase [Verrucomicrobiota bacterium]